MKIRTFWEWKKFDLIAGEHNCYIVPTIIINFNLRCIVFYWLYLTFEIYFSK